jgi:NAD(P)-dependent dehydrogenase (short-subunit alcohol dehydrogenase family)
MEGKDMRVIVLTVFLALNTSLVYAADPPPLFQQGDPESRFREAQLHVKELMNAGKYKEASEFMSVYQKLACEAGEQKAGRSREEGAAYCANKHSQAGMSASVQQRQQERLTTESIPSNTLAPGITMMQRQVPGSPTLVDGSAPSLLMFDPRTDPGSSSAGSSSRNERRTADPWTGAP